MKKIIFMLAITATVGLMSCKNDWTINDADLAPEASETESCRYVGNFTGPGSSALFAVEAPQAGEYTVVVRGRACSDVAGTGVVKVNGEALPITFEQQKAWNEEKVTVRLNQGVNDVDICKGSGNGLFYIDYIELN